MIGTKSRVCCDNARASRDELITNIVVMKATDYYRRRSQLASRGYLNDALCLEVLRRPEYTEIEPNGRIRHWARMPELGGRALRVVTLEDGETVHNAFVDRIYRPKERRR
jgi:hypothetical protein